MSRVALTDIYSVHTNFFHLNIDELGKVYKVNPDELENDIPYLREGDNYFTWIEGVGKQTELTQSRLQRSILWNLIQQFNENGYIRRGKYRVYSHDDKIDHPYQDMYKLYNGLRYRILRIYNDLFLCIDPSVFFESCASILEWYEKGVKIEKLSGFSIKFAESIYRISGYLIKTSFKDQLSCSIKLYRKIIDNSPMIDKEASLVYPEPRPEVIDELFRSCGIRHSTNRIIRKHSFIDDQTPGKNRLVKTLSIVEALDSILFPLEFSSFKISLSNEPTVVRL